MFLQKFLFLWLRDTNVCRQRSRFPGGPLVACLSIFYEDEELCGWRWHAGLKQPSELIFFSISIIAGVKSQTEIQIQIDSSHLITLPGTPVILRLDAKAICCDSLKLFAHWI